VQRISGIIPFAGLVFVVYLFLSSSEPLSFFATAWVVGVVFILTLLLLSNFSFGRRFWVRRHTRSSKKKSKIYTVDPHFTQAEGEEILIEPSVAVVQNIGWMSVGISPKTIILTNYRLILGRDVLPMKGSIMKEKMGILNFWKKSLADNPPDVTESIDDIGDVLGNIVLIDSKKIKALDVTLIERGDPRVIIQAKLLGLPIFFEIFHPEVKKIYEVLSQ
jgi:hypothetical protein